MVKKKTDSYTGWVLVIIVISVIAIIFILASRNTTFSVVQMDSMGNTINEDSLQMNTETLQSFFTTSAFKSSYLLQSFSPAEEEYTMQMRAVATNKLEENAILASVSVYKNDALLYSENIGLLMQPGQDYIYKSKELEMAGLDAQINIIRLDFSFRTQDGTITLQRFEYRYYSLTPCNSDSDCEVPHNICDKENVARFSRTAQAYCVKPCIDNSMCYPNQVCISGRCGY